MNISEISEISEIKISFVSSERSHLHRSAHWTHIENVWWRFYSATVLLDLTGHTPVFTGDAPLNTTRSHDLPWFNRIQVPKYEKLIHNSETVLWTLTSFPGIISAHQHISALGTLPVGIPKLFCRSQLLVNLGSQNNLKRESPVILFLL